MPRKAGYNHLPDTRNRIQAAQIINRLEAHIFADAPIMDNSQVNAAKTLLNKVLPDLASTTIEGGEKPLEIRIVIGGDEPGNA